jgi:hypothetical protein
VQLADPRENDPNVEEKRWSRPAAAPSILWPLAERAQQLVMLMASPSSHLIHLI